MALEIQFRQILQKELEKTLGMIETYKKDDLSKIWNCINNKDFLYGWHLGKVDDFCINQYFLKYHKTPTKEEKDEIQGILLVHAKDFKDRLMKSE